MTQELALKILKSGNNVFLTGSAGTGKTYVLNQYINYLKARKIRVAVTASTGIAATHMNGMTIHSWSGIGIKNNITSADLRNMSTKKYLTKNLEKVKVLIIDEISMLHKDQVEMVNIILKHFRKSNSAFGDIQVVFAGDFFQLPPIGDEPAKNKFAFMSTAWVEADLSICYLTEQYRQTNNSLNLILNEIRTGEVSQSAINQLKLASNNNLKITTEPTRLYTHNLDVDRINLEALNNLSSPIKKFTAKTKGNPKLIEGLKKSVQAPENVQLKLGAKVMFVKNNPEVGYINGSLGEIVGYTDVGYPIVRLVNGDKLTANPDTWSVDDDGGKSLAKFEQVPLRLAWAITVHKSQGMTLDAAEIDLSKTFERGQGYVALSRLKDLENLVLHGFNSTAIAVDSLALKADKRFQELSLQVEQNIDQDELEKNAIEFVEWCDGLTSEQEIEKEAKKQKRKEQKVSTYQLTKELVDQGKDIVEIANERGFSISTIITHLIKLKSEYPKLDLSKFKPNEKDLKKIRAAHKEVLKSTKKGEPFKLSDLRRTLNNEYEFADLKLALLFV